MNIHRFKVDCDLTTEAGNVGYRFSVFKATSDTRMESRMLRIPSSGNHYIKSENKRLKREGDPDVLKEKLIVLTR